MCSEVKGGDHLYEVEQKKKAHFHILKRRLNNEKEKVIVSKDQEPLQSEPKSHLKNPAREKIRYWYKFERKI